jgi:hypothetical protein
MGKYFGQKSEEEQPGSQKAETKQEGGARRQIFVFGTAPGTKKINPLCFGRPRRSMRLNYWYRDRSPIFPLSL